MRITENFVDPIAERRLHGKPGDLMQVSIALITDEPGPNRVELEFSKMTPYFRPQDLDILIGMLQAIQQRATR